MVGPQRGQRPGQRDGQRSGPSSLRGRPRRSTRAARARGPVRRRGHGGSPDQPDRFRRPVSGSLHRPPSAAGHPPGVRLDVVALDFRIAGLAPETVDYLDAWELQRRVHADVVGGADDTVLLLEHPPVFTAGKRTDPHERPADPGGAAVIDVDRGGKITFHGPGQLVGYPIVRLPDHVKVVDYVRRIEEALIGICASFGVTTARVPGRSGVWLRADERGPERKIAAIGLRVSRGVTMHGFSLNCDVDLGWYARFVPCGIADAGVTSLSAELGRDVTVPEVLPVVREQLARYLAWEDYTATPDYEARPEPPRIRLVTPSA
ncbi:lipoyl(octanoyl) transferase LipB [Nocardioides sp. MJB4]|uniref:Octanoyltransferase n=1 Tax=Nocardioides donggukensis TaxID=2774019 RepID=A0A927K671_9ACTN|nr:lipoyl(octanoyl) transferase LipB [Nocardioides donggukensis]